MRKNYKAEAIVIHRRDLSEKDRIVTFISPFEGKFDAVCKGVKKLTSPSGGKFEPFNRLNLFISTGKTLDVVSQSQLLDSFPQVRKSLEKTSAALYILDIINRFVEKYERNPKLYYLLKTSMEMLEKGINPRIAGLIFEIRFISLMGYQPHLNECVECQKSGDHCYFDYSRGGVVCEECRKEIKEKNNGKKISPGVLRSFRYMQQSNLPTASRLNIPPFMCDEMKYIIDRYITYNIPGKPIEKQCYYKLNK